MTNVLYPTNYTTEFVVSGFYGPGGWAAWCISLVASWAPILFENYTHNFHLIAYALYMNWAAMDSFRYLSLKRRLDELDSRKQRLNPHLLFFATNDSDTFIFQKHWPSDLDEDTPWDLETIPIAENITRQSQEANIRLDNMTEPVHELWDNYTTPTTTDLTSELRNIYTQVAIDKKVLQQQESILWDQIHQLQAAFAVLNVGMLHSWVQLLVSIWKTHKCDSIETATSYRRRNLIITTSLVLPSISQVTDLLLHGEYTDEWWVPILWTYGFLITTTWALQYSTSIAPLLPEVGTLFTCIFELGWALFIAGLYALYFCSLTCMHFKGPRCGLMPNASTKITEMDQAFTLFAALLWFLYDFRPLFVRFFKLLRLHFEKLVFGAGAHDNTLAGMPLGLPY